MENPTKEVRRADSVRSRRPRCTAPFRAGSTAKKRSSSRLALGHELDTAVGQVANIARDVKTPGQRPARKAKPDALNPAREIDSATITRHGIRPRSTGAGYGEHRRSCPAPLQPNAVTETFQVNQCILAAAGRTEASASCREPSARPTESRRRPSLARRSAGGLS